MRSTPGGSSRAVQRRLAPHAFAVLGDDFFRRRSLASPVSQPGQVRAHCENGTTRWQKSLRLAPSGESIEPCEAIYSEGAAVSVCSPATVNKPPVMVAAFAVSWHPIAIFTIVYASINTSALCHDDELQASRNIYRRVVNPSASHRAAASTAPTRWHPPSSMSCHPAQLPPDSSAAAGTGSQPASGASESHSMVFMAALAHGFADDVVQLVTHHVPSLIAYRWPQTPL